MLAGGKELALTGGVALALSIGSVAPTELLLAVLFMDVNVQRVLGLAVAFHLLAACCAAAGGLPLCGLVSALA